MKVHGRACQHCDTVYLILIAVLARLSAIFIIFLTGSLLFSIVFSIELEYFELKLNQLNDF